MKLTVLIPRTENDRRVAEILKRYVSTGLMRLKHRTILRSSRRIRQRQRKHWQRGQRQMMRDSRC